MSLVFDYIPPDLMASRNPVAVGISDSSGQLQQVACKLYVETAWHSNNFIRVHTELRDFDSEGKAVFRFETILDSELQMADYHFGRDYSVNLTAGSGHPPPQQGPNVKRYVAVFQAETTRRLNLGNYDLILDQKYAIKANQPFEDFNHREAFPAGLLSHLPNTRPHLPGQQQWAWLMTGENFPMSVNWTAYYADVAPESGVVNYAGASWGKFLPRGIPLHNFWDAKERATLDAMEFSFPGFDLPAIRLERKYEGYEFLREFHYDNGLGGFDCFIAYGRSTREDAFQADEARRFLPSNYPDNADSLQSLAREFRRYNVSSSTGITTHLGFRSEEERDACRAIFHANQAFERKDGKFLPIRIISNKIKFNADGDFKYSFDFAYQYAFENHGLWH